MPHNTRTDVSHVNDILKTNLSTMSDAELREFAMAQLSCLNDYRQQLILRRHQLSKLTYERTEREKQIASGEKMLQERQERLSSKKKRLANLQILKEEAQMKMSAAAALATDVEKLKEKYSVKESCLRSLVGEVEQLNAEQRKLQQELNAGVVSISLLSADVNRLTDEILQTDECNVEYEAQLSRQHEKMRQQQRHLKALQQNIVQLNQQLETAASKGAFGVVRQNANYRSLPPGAKSQSLLSHTTQQGTDAERCKDTQKFDGCRFEDNAQSKNGIYANSAPNSLVGNASVTASGEVINSSYTSTPVNSFQWSHPTDISHSENLRTTSYRMIGRFASQQADTLHQSERLVATANVDHSTSSLSLGQRSVDVAMTTDSSHVRRPVTVDESRELEERLQPTDSCPSLQHKTDVVGLVTSDVSSQPSRSTDGSSDLVLLPDVIGFTASTLSVSSSSKVPPPVAQKSKFHYSSSSAYGIRSSDSIPAFTEPTVITTDLNSPQNTNSTRDSTLHCNASFSVDQELVLDKSESKNMSDELPLTKSHDLSPKDKFSDDDVQDSTDSSRSVDRPVYKPSVTCPVRRRLSTREEPSFTSSASGDVHGNADTGSAVEDSPVSSDVNLSKVQTVKKKLRAGISRKVQFEPLALLLDAALEGEMDLLQTTLKVCDASAANDEGITALHNAICAGHLSIAAYLVNYGCDVNAPDNDGWTPLHCAASCNNVDITQLLVLHGACAFVTALSDNEKPSEKCEPDEDNYDSCLQFLQDVEMQMKKPGTAVYAAFDYSAENADELTFSVGDELTVLQCGDDVETDWWWCQLGELKGYVPQNLVALHPRKVPSWMS